MNGEKYSDHILVTGGSGYLGSTLVPLLLSHGYRVTVFDLFAYGPSPLFASLGHPLFKLIKGDIRDLSALSAAVGEDVKCIIHLAAIVGYPACDKSSDLANSVNVDGTRNICQLSLKRELKLIFSSTGSCYGKLDDICTEESPTNPLSLYGKTKLIGEEEVLKVDGIVLRFATLFGISPRFRLDLLLNDISYKALKEKFVSVYEPGFRRTFLHVKDAANGVLFAFENYAAMFGNIFNVGDDRLNISKGDAVKKICKFVPNCVLKMSEEGEDKDKRDYEVSYQKINKLGYKATISLDDGIQELMTILPLLKAHEISQASCIIEN